MSDSADSASAPAERVRDDEDPRAMERRIFRDMCVAAALAPVISAPLAPWRVTFGLILGGVLALLNHHWLRTGVAAAFGGAAPGARPELKASRYVLRYAVVAGSLAAAHGLELVSLSAALAGMCAVVPALLAEGFRQLYFAIVRREETP